MDRVAELHHRASSWFEQHESTDGAVRHAIQAANYDLAASLMEELATRCWQRGQPIGLSGWVEAIPDEHVAARPTLCIYHAWELTINGKQKAAAERLQQIERVLAQKTPPFDAGNIAGARMKSEIAARVAAIRASIANYRGEYDKGIRYASLANASLSTGDQVLPKS